MNANGSNSPKPRGFATLTPERRREISRMGGVSAHVKGTAHEWDVATAREAGRKGGLSHRARRMAATAPTPRIVESGTPADEERDAS